MKTPLGSASIAAADTALSSLEPHSETGASTPPINSLPNGSSVPSRKRKTQDALGDDVPQKNPKSVSSSSNAKPQSKMPTAKSYPPTSTRLADRGGLGGTVENPLELVAMPLRHLEIYAAPKYTGARNTTRWISISYRG
ncbi:hypothetical protein M408DRAFT_145924 [Serendipita vermifera MAFF 305830]|uniref:Uncharacterized protein n=1 Tax=Serendipita vermifera MAFF 305830 TaxID=933852 RepID=A0A0C3A6F2_SERVB|nr:hypothetical protein M408DRAFT_145924 [Serendipita vermifera MAFF 305830]